MALLGAQLVITLVMVSVIQKVSPHFSLAKWLLCSTGLTRFLHPTDSELKTLAGVPKNLNKGKKNGFKSNDEKSNTFHVPRSLDITLESAKISQLDVVHLRYFSEYQWLVDFSVYAIVVYILSEIYHFYFPLKDEFNLSMMWCLLVVFFAFKLLISLTVQYFKSEESIGERSTCIVTGLSYLLIAMMVLIVDENTLETGLEEAYRSFNQSASTFLEAQGLQSSGPVSKIIVKFTIAVGCGLVGAIFTFPGLRMARMHWDSLKYCKGNKMMQLLLNVNFALPFLLVILWIKPITRDYFTTRTLFGNDSPMLSSEMFDVVRFAFIIFAVLLRFCLMPVYLQAYLNLAYDRVEEQKKEAGRITNVELQKKIASIFYYLCVVTLQYVAPIILCLFLSFMYKTLGGYSWLGLYEALTPSDECTAEGSGGAALAADFHSFDTDTDIVDTESSVDALQISWASIKQIFATEVFRGLFGFATWWSCFVWFAASSLGMLYQTYFTKS